jgi:hypothetical protein
MAKTKDPQTNIQDQQVQVNTTNQNPVGIIFPQLPGVAATNHLALNVAGSMIDEEGNT